MTMQYAHNIVSTQTGQDVNMPKGVYVMIYQRLQMVLQQQFETTLVHTA